jgi:integrase
MATIERRTSHGQNVYYVKVRRKGYPPQSATFHKLSDAKRWAQMTEGAIVEGRYFSPNDAKRHTINDLLSRYRQDVFPQKRSSTVYNQVYHLRWWETQLGHYALAEITPALIVEYRDKLARTRKNSTVRRYLAVLSHAFSLAVEWQWANENPVNKVRKPKEPRGRVRFLTDDERERLLAACKVSRNRYLYLIVVLAISTGARRGELLSLRWPDVDLKRCTLTFHETKNGERRAVPCTGFALDLLKQHAKGRCPGTSLVFPDAKGRKPLSMKDAFANSVQRAGIADFRFHDLRHTFASYLAMQGASLLDIATVLGHKTLQMVQRYAHLSEAHTAGGSSTHERCDLWCMTL